MVGEWGKLNFFRVSREDKQALKEGS